MQIKIADLSIRIENRHTYIEDLCEAYREPSGAFDFSVAVSEADILAEDAGREHPGYAESLAVYRKIAESILERDGFLLHGVVLDVDGRGVAFLAPSGVGKSTHAALWKKLLGERATVINGDKPLVRFIDGVPYAYGTPWAGKEGLSKNARTPLSAICFLTRSVENSIVPMPKQEVLLALLKQIYLPKDGAKMGTLLDLLARFTEKVTFYSVGCNMDIDAALIPYRTIFGENE